MTGVERIQLVVDYCEQHLLDRNVLTTAVGTAGVSLYHFYRIFYAIVGTTPGDYLRRRRLTEAANILLTTKQQILGIALDFGFESHEAFTRAFKSVYGMTPSQYRKNRQVMPIFDKKQLTGEMIMHLFDGISHEPRFVKKDAFDVVGIEGVSTKNNNIIPDLWEQFLPRAHEVQHKIGKKICYGLCMMNEPFDPKTADDDSPFTAVVSVPVSKVDKIPQGMVHRQVPAQEYAVFTHKGRFFPDRLMKSYDYIYGTWFPKSELKTIGKIDFEYYDERFKGVDNDETEIDIYIPVQR